MCKRRRGGGRLEVGGLEVVVLRREGGRGGVGRGG